MPLMQEQVYDLWVESAAAGEPPFIGDVATQMFGYTSPWFWGEHYFPYVEQMGDTTRKILLEREMSRGHSKTAVAHLIALYCASFKIPFIRNTRHENRRILIIGRDVQHAKDQMAELDAAICEYAPWLKYEDWQLRGDAEAMKGVSQKGARTWNMLQMRLTNGVEVRGFSIDQSVRRFHCYLAIIDDLVTEQNWAEADLHVELIESSVLKAIEFGGLVLLQGTPQDDGDAYAVIAADSKWNPIHLKGKSEDYIEKNRKALQTGELPPRENGKPYSKEDLRCLWPWRMDAEQHRFERGSTRESQLRYEREIMLERITVASSLVQVEDIYACLDPTLYYVNEAVPGEDYGAGADPSALSRSDAAICVGTQHEGGVYVPRHFTVLEAMGASRPDDSTLRVTKEINTVSSAFGNPLTYVESNQFQEMIGPVSKAHINDQGTLIPYHLGGQKHTESGWVGVRTLFANRKVKLPYGPTPLERAQIEAGIRDKDDFEAKRITDKFIRQLTSIKKNKDRVETPKGRKDDMVSAFFLMLKAVAIVFGGSGGAMSASLPTVVGVDAYRGKNPLNSTAREDPELDPNPVSMDFQSRFNRVMQRHGSSRTRLR